MISRSLLGSLSPLLLSLLLPLLPVCAQAAVADLPEGARSFAGTEPSPRPVTSISPIFGQLFSFSFPRGFVPAYENTVAGTSYTREAVLDGESVTRWTQMITVTGFKGASANANITPALFAGSLAAGYKKACPGSLSSVVVGDTPISGYQGFLMIVSCGNVAQPSPHSEAAVIVVIKGQQDYYTLQWAERGAPSVTPLEIDQLKWRDRLQALAPVKLCPIVPGEPAPYASCLSALAPAPAGPQ